MKRRATARAAVVMVALSAVAAGCASTSRVPSSLRSVLGADPSAGDDPASSRVTHRIDPRASIQTPATATSPVCGWRRWSPKRTVPYTALMKSTNPNMTVILHDHEE